TRPTNRARSSAAMKSRKASAAVASAGARCRSLPNASPKAGAARRARRIPPTKPRSPKAWRMKPRTAPRMARKTMSAAQKRSNTTVCPGPSASARRGQSPLRLQCSGPSASARRGQSPLPPLPHRCVALHELPRLDSLRLVVRVGGLVRQRHLEVPLRRGEPLAGHVGEPRHEELAPLRGGADLLLLVLLQLLLALLDEAELSQPIRSAHVGEVLGA